MKTDIDIPLIIDATTRVGKLYLKDYKKKPIPQTMEQLVNQLKEMEAVCFSSLKDSLAIEFPDIPWVADDEFDTDGQRKPAQIPEYWLCDTMDGAVQYVQHLPGWTINLVLIRNGQPYISVIYDPLADEVFWAKDGAGAFLNGIAIVPSQKSDVSIMMTVFEYGHQDKTNNNLNQKIGASLTDLLDDFGIVRNYGPHGLQLAYIGAGRIDLFLQEDLDTHNWLAGMLIAKEAGAVILNTNGQPWIWGDENLLVATKGAADKFISAKKLKAGQI
jgi:myo-inositol-1(or 4)-monophosphatase